MWLSCIILFFVLAVNVYGETLENIRQQFEIYQRHPGEIEILSTDNAQEIEGVLKRTITKRMAVRKELDKVPADKQSKKKLPSLLIAENYAVPFTYYAAVERAFAKQSLQQGKPDDALQSIQYVYRLTDELVDTGTLKLCAAAALIRIQMQETVQAFLQNPLCRHEHHELLYTLFEKQLNRKETDQTTWTRYEEEGKRFFDETRRSGLDETVPPKLLKELLDRHALEGYEKATAERFIHDQSVFREIMSAVIESCALPYYRRQQVLLQLDKELRVRQRTPTEPVFAILLLREVSESMRFFAQEQSGIEMAYLALAASLNGQPRRKTMNFLTGKEYELHLITNGIMCTYEGNVKPFYVPYQ